MKSIAWRNNGIRIIDQTLLPGKFVYRQLKDVQSLAEAIKKLRVRGAPALGAAAALGVYLGVKDSRAKDFPPFFRQFEAVRKYIASSRPTARNLFWGLERMQQVALSHRDKPVAKIKQKLYAEAIRIVEEDRQTCRAIGRYGAGLIQDGDAILTVCNAGILATIDYGTALGVLYRAKEEGKRFKVYACETRPLLQGARLTTWELKKNGVEVTLICDNMAATLMQQGRINKVITGADRIALNGDTANKIGTYSLAVLSRYHAIPFYVAAPCATFDTCIRTGKEIVIEQRSSEEVTSLFSGRPIAAQGVKVYNPAFDVTPGELIRAFITDKGIIRSPFYKNVIRILKK
jgi:methylthioribose-1-phosphate isomerase